MRPVVSLWTCWGCGHTPQPWHGYIILEFYISTLTNIYLLLFQLHSSQQSLLTSLFFRTPYFSYPKSSSISLIIPTTPLSYSQLFQSFDNLKSAVEDEWITNKIVFKCISKIRIELITDANIPQFVQLELLKISLFAYRESLQVKQEQTILRIVDYSYNMIV